MHGQSFEACKERPPDRDELEFTGHSFPLADSQDRPATRIVARFDHEVSTVLFVARPSSNCQEMADPKPVFNVSARGDRLYVTEAPWNA